MTDDLVKHVQEVLDVLTQKYPEAMLSTYSWGGNPRFHWRFKTIYVERRHRGFRKLKDLNEIELVALVRTMPDFIAKVETQHAEIPRERPAQEVRYQDAVRVLKDLLVELRG